MTRGFLPTTDTGMEGWARNCLAKVSGDPQAWGLSQQIVDDFAAAYAAYAQALRIAREPGTRTVPAVREKNTCRDELKIQARQIGHLVDANRAIPDSQRILLGLTIRKRWSRMGRPGERPYVSVSNIRGHELRVELRESTNGRHAVPAGVASAQLYWTTGETPPAGFAQWRSIGSTTRTRLSIRIPADVPPGTMVWVSACWQNPRCEPGPMANPVCAYVQFGGMQPISSRRAA